MRYELNSFKIKRVESKISSLATDNITSKHLKLKKRLFYEGSRYWCQFTALLVMSELPLNGCLY